MIASRWKSNETRTEPVNLRQRVSNESTVLLLLCLCMILSVFMRENLYKTKAQYDHTKFTNNSILDGYKTVFFCKALTKFLMLILLIRIQNFHLQLQLEIIINES